VIVSSRRYNATRPDVVVAAVASQLRSNGGFGEVWLTDWGGAGLLKPSVVKPVFATLEQSLIIRKMGTLKPADAEAVRKTPS
jgi:mRNA interferase MazF